MKTCKFKCQVEPGRFELCGRPGVYHADKSQPSERVDHEHGYTFLHPSTQGDYCYYHDKVVRKVVTHDWAGRKYIGDCGFPDTTTFNESKNGIFWF